MALPHDSYLQQYFKDVFSSLRQGWLYSRPALATLSCSQFQLAVTGFPRLPDPQLHALPAAGWAHPSCLWCKA